MIRVRLCEHVAAKTEGQGGGPGGGSKNIQLGVTSWINALKWRQATITLVTHLQKHFSCI